ncbi:FKBP-type peptidyl-prolyl cis-trans isomerase [Sphingobacterium sp. UDSM-2020]|uniref:FKBP-type peptidyl-prolyl cis-trans isomerase n=1 Tax=Sphingobacterium sp. UDSM-2020 TaxID=2795738 RepID=UPI001936D53C|nr:peptidylprolyl isomerase [Sphingobacterium sp. UDSM-2020]QQD15784.1 peptidylprolyl isomerase [Sphingobacterium sp. UDSM-2020]
MKNLTKIFFGMLAMFIALASCSKSDDFSKLVEEQRIKDSIENARIQSILKEQAPAVKAYALANFTSPTLHDSSGIYYQIVTPGDEASYTYKISGNGLAAPEISVKFIGKLLDGTVFDQSAVDQTTNFSSLQIAINKFGGSWYYAFVPKTINYNGNDIKFLGFTATGLKKGSVIKFVTPSVWGFDANEYKTGSENVTVPANTPIAYTIEVVSIK